MCPPYSNQSRSKAFFEEVFERVRREGELKEADAIILLRFFKGRYRKALEAVAGERVRRYVFSPGGRTVWTVLGEEQEYQILPLSDYCSCNDFYFRVLSREAPLCYHLIAQKIAEALGKYVLIEAREGEYEALMSELRKPPAEHRKLSREEAENVREAIKSILSREELSARQLLLRVQSLGFEVSTPQHLASILISDRRKRFKCESGKWLLRSQSREKG